MTGTVESIPLITASILSKKLAEGIDGLVMDVKSGRGAFMKTRADARTLAESIVGVGNANGVRTEALITAMDAPARPGRRATRWRSSSASRRSKGRGPRDLEDLSVIAGGTDGPAGRAGGDRRRGGSQGPDGPDQRGRAGEVPPDRRATRRRPAGCRRLRPVRRGPAANDRRRRTGPGT